MTLTASDRDFLQRASIDQLRLEVFYARYHQDWEYLVAAENMLYYKLERRAQLEAVRDRKTA